MQGKHGLIHVFLGNQSGLSPSPWSNLREAKTSRWEVPLLPSNNPPVAMFWPPRLVISASSWARPRSLESKPLFRNSTGLSPLRNPTQTEDGDLFGRSLEGCDVNNDGYDDLIVGNMFL